MCDERRKLKQQRFQQEGAEQYRKVNKNIRKAMKKAKENWIDELCENINSNLLRNNTKQAYQIVKDLTSAKQGKVSTIQDKSGKCLTEEKEILARWTEYCSDLYNHDTKGDPAVLTSTPSTNQDDFSILYEAVEAAIKTLKKGKTAGLDNVPSELVQEGGKP